ncbi:MAG: DUF2267 domain-containing protein [Micromonosporaceae bacterium]
MAYDDFINAVASRTAVSTAQASTITEATLRTLADRISGGEANDLADQLPEGLDDYLRKPLPARETAQPFGLGEFVQRVAARAGVDGVLASSGVRAVLTTMRETVSADEFDDMVAQLPKEFWQVVQPEDVPAGARGRPQAATPRPRSNPVGSRRRRGRLQ